MSLEAPRALIDTQTTEAAAALIQLFVRGLKTRLAR